MPSLTISQQLSQGDTVVAPGIFDAFSAASAAQAGFQAAYLSGASIAYCRFGRPDIGLVSMREVADTVSEIRERVDLPLFVDADTGFGNALNVQRTVKLFERNGANCIQLEDQTLPKRCGHLNGKTLVGASEAVGDAATVRRIMGHLADGEADVEVRLAEEPGGGAVRQGTFLSRAYRPDGERLALTCARHDALDEGVAAPDEVTLVFVLQDRLLQCTCPVLELDRTWLDDDLYLQTLMLAYPETVSWGQRRGSFRMAPPERIRGRVCRDTDGDVVAGACANVRVEDLSLTGARLQLDGSAILSGFKGGARVRCTLVLPPGYGEVTVSARVRRLHVVRDDPTERGAMVGVEFTGGDQDASDLATLRRYVEDRCADRLSRGSVDLQIG